MVGIIWHGRAAVRRDAPTSPRMRSGQRRWVEFRRCESVVRMCDQDDDERDDGKDDCENNAPRCVGSHLARLPVCLPALVLVDAASLYCTVDWQAWVAGGRNRSEFVLCRPALLRRAGDGMNSFAIGPIGGARPAALRPSGTESTAAARFSAAAARPLATAIRSPRPPGFRARNTCM
jgi:hypothetical protein